MNTDLNLSTPISNDESDQFTNDSDKFKAQQKDDPSQKQCQSDPENKSNNFLVKDELLPHRDKVLDETVYQLVIPVVRRKQLLELVQSSP